MDVGASLAVRWTRRAVILGLRFDAPWREESTAVEHVASADSDD